MSSDPKETEVLLGQPAMDSEGKQENIYEQWKPDSTSLQRAAAKKPTTATLFVFAILSHVGAVANLDHAIACLPFTFATSQTPRSDSRLSPRMPRLPGLRDCHVRPGGGGDPKVLHRSELLCCAGGWLRRRPARQAPQIRRLPPAVRPTRLRLFPVAAPVALPASCAPPPAPAWLQGRRCRGHTATELENAPPVALPAARC